MLTIRPIKTWFSIRCCIAESIEFSWAFARWIGLFLYGYFDWIRTHFNWINNNNINRYRYRVSGLFDMNKMLNIWLLLAVRRICLGCYLLFCSYCIDKIVLNENFKLPSSNCAQVQRRPKGKSFDAFYPSFFIGPGTFFVLVGLYGGKGTAQMY